VTEPGPPRINTLIDVRFPDGREFPSRVEDTDGHALILAAPFGGGVEPPEPGSAFEMCWTSPRGRYVAPIRLLSVRRGELPSWIVEVAGDIYLHQRRRYVRAGGGESIQVRPCEPEDAGMLSGRVVDISEGGLRCWLESGDLSRELYPGQPVSVTVGLESDQVVIVGEVLRILPGRPEKGVDAVIVFELPEGTAGLVRRYVLHSQLLARRLSADSSR